MSLVSNVFNTSSYKPKEKKKSGLTRFADTISAPFEAVSNVLGLPQTVETLAKPFVETYAGIQELRGKETSRWVKEHGLQTPETAALMTKGATDENLGALVKQKKAEGYKGANVTDILNVAALAPGLGTFAKGTKALGSASQVASGAERFLPTLGRTLKSTVPAGAGWGAAYGAAGAYDQGGSLSDIGEGALVGGLTGTAVGGGLGVAGASIGSLANKAASLVNKDARLKKIVDTNSSALQKVSDGNAQVRKIVDHSMDSGVDVIKKAAETNYLQGATDKEGIIRSKQKGGGAERLELDIGENAGTVSENLARENRRISIDAVKQEMIDALDSSTISSGEAYTAALAKIEREIGGMERFMDGDRTIPVLKVHEAKMYKGKNLRKAFLDPDASQADKLITRVYKELIEKNTDSIDVKRINQELSEAYALLNFIKSLDGKRVEGGKLGRYFAQTVGAMVGSHFGPVGSIIGAEVGGGIRGAQLGSVFSKSTGKTLEVSDLMRKANALGKSPRPVPETIPESRRLPAPAMTTPTADTSGLLSQEEARAKLRSYGVTVDDLAPQSSKSLGSLNTSQSKTMTPTSIGISKSVAERPKVDINSVESLEAEITRRVEKFRKEAGFVAQREGAGVKMVTPDNGLDSANTESFTKFNLNRAKGNMKSQADSAKKYSQTMLYESDPEFRNIVDIHDALLESKIVEAKTIPEVDALFSKVDDEIKTIESEQTLYETNKNTETTSIPSETPGESISTEDPFDRTHVGKDYFHGSKADFTEIKVSNKKVGLDAFGRGIYITPDVNYAKNYGEKIYNFKLKPDTNILNIFSDKPLGEKISKDIVENLNRNGVESTLVDGWIETPFGRADTQSGGNAIVRLNFMLKKNGEDSAVISSVLKDSGVDGLSLTKDNIVIFNKEKLVNETPSTPKGNKGNGLGQEKGTSAKALKAANKKQFDDAMMKDVADHYKSKSDSSLLSEAKKYNSFSDFKQAVYGGKTQFGDYSPNMREAMPAGYTKITELGVDPDKMVTIYRGIDDISGKVKRKINDGDFVTTDYDSARAYTGDSKDVVEMHVKANTLYNSEPNDFTREPFYTGAEYIYTSKDTKALPSDAELLDIYKKAHGDKLGKLRKK